MSVQRPVRGDVKLKFTDLVRRAVESQKTRRVASPLPPRCQGQVSRLDCWGTEIAAAVDGVTDARVLERW